MKLFLLTQFQETGYDTYESAVVVAPDEETARQMNPEDGEQMEWGAEYGTWCNRPEDVTVRYLGEAADDAEYGILCASFHAG